MGFITFLNDNSSAVFALAGVFGTGLFSFGTAWLLKRRGYSLKVWEKISERRIQAHERILILALELRVMVALGGIDENKEALRTPNLMLSKEHFESWFVEFTSGSVAGSPWQTTFVKHEVNLVQDYMVTLYQTLIGLPSDLYPNVGLLIRQDFIDLSSSLEKKAFAFFESDIQKLKLSSLEKWHKYPKNETKRRLQNTALLKHQEAIVSRKHPVFSEVVYTIGEL